MHDLVRLAMNRYYAPFSLMGFIKNSDGTRSVHRESGTNRTKYHDVGELNAVIEWQRVTAVKYNNVPENVRVALTPERDRVEMVFIDDIKGDEVEVMALVPGHLFLETSHENWQVHFILDHEYSIKDAHSIQTQLSLKYGGDPRARGGIQPRRHPLNCISIVEALDRPLCVLAPTHEEFEKVDVQPVSVPTTAAVSQKDLEAYKRRWDKKFANGNNASSADFIVTLSCIGDRLDDEKIAYVLAVVSNNLFGRKGDYLEQYIARTIAKARMNRPNIVDSKIRLHLDNS